MSSVLSRILQSPLAQYRTSPYSFLGLLGEHKRDPLTAWRISKSAARASMEKLSEFGVQVCERR